MVAREFVGTVIAVEPAMGDAVLLTFSCPPEVAASAQAGRVVRLLCRDDHSFDPLLPRSFPLYDASPNSGPLTVLVQPTDRGSSWLAERQVGDRLTAFGLFGNAFMMTPKALNLLLIAGGQKVAPLVMLARTAIESGRNVTFLMGAGSDEDLLLPSRLPADVEYVVTTDDGSHGHSGVVTDLVPSYIRWADQVFASGPAAMYRSLQAHLKAHRIGEHPRAQVMIDRQITCGFGVCLGCIVETRCGPAAACVQGPIFDLDDVVW